MRTIQAGVHIEVTDALGRKLPKRALSEIEESGAFAVVWACSEDEWATAHAEDREPEADPFPWPVQDVTFIEREPAPI